MKIRYGKGYLKAKVIGTYTRYIKGKRITSHKIGPDGAPSLKKTLTLHRVPYGQKNIPTNMKEYQMSSGGPVGTQKEWKEFASKVGAKPKFSEKKLGIEGYFR